MKTLLKADGHGNDIHDPSLGLRHLLKAKNNVMSELIGRVVIHIFDQDAELLLLLLLAFIDITELHGRIQDLFAHLLADIRGVVQGFGNRAF